jgi:hypothetical protein
MFVTVSCMAQGQILWQNFLRGSVDAKITDSKTGLPIAANTYTVELLAGKAADTLATTGIKTAVTLANGYFLGGAQTVAGIAAGSDAFFKVRAYLTSAGSFDASLVSRGESAVFSMKLTEPPATPAAMTAMTAFSVAPVPEPSILALGVLGMGALMLRRRS